MKLSVVIPAFNRWEVLSQALEALFEQAVPGMEVLVVDDGSTLAPPEQIQVWSEAGKIRYLRQENKGPAAARNLGIREAKGELILFLGHDILLEPEALARHLEGHLLHPEPSVAVLGKVEWKPPVTPFMQWLHRSGVEFAFERLRAGWVDFRSCYTCNISFKTALLREQGGFDERLPYGFEDTEIGYRLSKAGIRILYDPLIRALHDHPMDLAYSLARFHRIAPSAMVLVQTHPELADEVFHYAMKPSLTARFLLLMASAFAPIWPKAQRAVWRWRTRIAYYEGLRAQGWHP